MSFNVAISGKMRSGKDTVAEIIKQCLGDTLDESTAKCIELKFAKPVKDFCNTIEVYQVLPPPMFKQGIDPIVQNFVGSIQRWSSAPIYIDDIYRIIETTSSGRDRVRAIAEHIRNYSPNVWIDILAPQALAEMAAGRSVIISDLRFMKEAEWAERVGFYRVRIEVNPEVQAERLWEEGIDPAIIGISERSETDLDKYTRFSWTISNNDSYDHLTHSVSLMVQKMLSIQRSIAKNT